MLPDGLYSVSFGRATMTHVCTNVEYAYDRVPTMSVFVDNYDGDGDVFHLRTKRKACMVEQITSKSFTQWQLHAKTTGNNDLMLAASIEARKFHKGRIVGVVFKQ